VLFFGPAFSVEDKRSSPAGRIVQTAGQWFKSKWSGKWSGLAAEEGSPNPVRCVGPDAPLAGS